MGREQSESEKGNSRMMNDQLCEVLQVRLGLGASHQMYHSEVIL